MTQGFRLQILSQPAFTRVGETLLGSMWEEGQENYESFWLDPESPQRSRGEIFLLGWMDADHPVARLALWKPSEGESLFFLYARDRFLPAEAVVEFLSEVKRFAREKGVNALSGPMAFSTWHPYRFISRMGDTDFFAGEQRMPEEDCADFIRSGFSSIAEYQTTLVEDLAESMRIGAAMGVEQGLGAINVEIFGKDRLPQILPELHRLSCEIFKDNFAYSHLDFQEFLASLGKSKTEEATLIIAYIQEKPAGFTFSYAIGSYDPGNGKPARETAVLKTLGVHPDYRGLKAGRNLKLAYGLAYLTHNYWIEKGCGSILHAYMKTDNRSRFMAAHFGLPIRDYVLVRGEF